jgi:hypothetical protein
LTAREGHPSEIVPFLAIRSEVEWALWVEPVWKEFVRPLPLLGIEVKPIVNHEAHLHTLLKGESIGCDLFFKLVD